MINRLLGSQCNLQLMAVHSARRELRSKSQIQSPVRSRTLEDAASALAMYSSMQLQKPYHPNGQHVPSKAGCQ
jgi:hypothetical protein